METNTILIIAAVVFSLICIKLTLSARKSYKQKEREMIRSIESYRLMEKRADEERRKAREQRLSPPVYKNPEVKSALTTKTVRKSPPSNGYYSRRPADDSDDVTSMIMMNNMINSIDTTPSYSYSSSSDDSCSRSSYESSSSSSYSSYSSDSSSSYSSSDSGSSSSSCD